MLYYFVVDDSKLDEVGFVLAYILDQELDEID